MESGSCCFFFRDRAGGVFLAGLFLAAIQLDGQQQPTSPSVAPRTPGAAPAKDISGSWEGIITELLPKAEVSPALSQTQTPVLRGPADDFADHIFLELRTEYQRHDIGFTGQPTLTGLINAPFNGIFNPNGFAWDRAFQPDTNRLYSFLSFGTRGWLSDRVNTHFGVRYRQDLTNVNTESPDANVLGTYRGNRLLELVEGSVEISGKPADGAWAGTTTQIGRLNIYGAELASLDGASINVNRGRFSVGFFGGRRYSYYSDPDQRGIGGGSLAFRPDANTSIGYDALFYVHGSHRFNLRRNLSRELTLTSFFRLYGGSPVDLSVQLMFHPRDGKTSARAGFFQKLTNRDYNYDIYGSARDLDPYNRLYRLYLGSIQPYSQFVADAEHVFTPRLILSGTVVVNRLNGGDNDQSAFQTSFEDYRVGAKIQPIRRYLMDFDYHERDSGRLPPIVRTTFDDTHTSGETSVKDLTGQLRREFWEGRVSLSGGAYYRRISIQDRFLVTEGAHQSGWLAGAWFKTSDHHRFFVDYSLDNDFFVFRPAIASARALRLGWVWKY